MAGENDVVNCTVEFNEGHVIPQIGNSFPDLGHVQHTVCTTMLFAPFNRED